MIISRAPVRLTLGGGGTDLPSYYEKCGGYSITGAINRYVFVGAYEQFYPSIKLKYSKIEDVQTIDKIEHPLFREALRYVGINNQIELTSLADIPSGSGLGSSGAFLVALLNTLFEYRGLTISKRGLAEAACNIELDILKLHEGKQDKFACSYGGIKAFTYSKNGHVVVAPFSDEDSLQLELRDKLMLFYTGRERKETASDALKHQNGKFKKNDKQMLDYFDEIKNIGYETYTAFNIRDLDRFGQLLNEHWEIKRNYSKDKIDETIDKCYKTALDYGALGGKIMGAGLGGFFLFYHPGTEKEKWEFEAQMKQFGLSREYFDFDNEGVTTIFRGQ